MNLYSNKINKSKEKIKVKARILLSSKNKEKRYIKIITEDQKKP